MFGENPAKDLMEIFRPPSAEELDWINGKPGTYSPVVTGPPSPPPQESGVGTSSAAPALEKAPDPKPFIFRESATWKGKPTKHRRTFVIIVGRVRADVGISRCSTLDSFNRKRGREIAEGRALRKRGGGADGTHSYCLNLRGIKDYPSEHNRSESAKWFLLYLKKYCCFRWEPRKSGAL